MQNPLQISDFPLAIFNHLSKEVRSLVTNASPSMELNDIISGRHNKMACKLLIPVYTSLWKQRPGTERLTTVAVRTWE